MSEFQMCSAKFSAIRFSLEILEITPQQKGAFTTEFAVNRIVGLEKCAKPTVRIEVLLDNFYKFRRANCAGTKNS